MTFQQKLEAPHVIMCASTLVEAFSQLLQYLPTSAFTQVRDALNNNTTLTALCDI